MDRLRKLIEDLAMTKGEICKKAGVSRPTLDNLLSDDPRYTPTLLSIKKICKALGVDWKDFV